MAVIAPETAITLAVFGNEAVDVRILFQIPAKGVENHDKPRSIVQGFILFEKHTGNNTVYNMKKTVK